VREDSDISWEIFDERITGLLNRSWDIVWNKYQTTQQDSEEQPGTAASHTAGTNSHRLFHTPPPASGVLKTAVARQQAAMQGPSGTAPSR
jgi:hypothetical protein